MNTNNIGHECGTEENKHCDSHEKHRRTSLEGAGASCKPMEYEFHREQEEQRPSNACQQDPERHQPRPCVHESDGKGQQRPSHNIVSNSCGQNDDSNGGIQQFEFCQDTTQDGECCDRVRDAGEKHEMGELDGRVDKLVVQRNGESRAEAKWNGHAGEGDGDGKACVALDYTSVDLQADQKEKQAETNVCDERKIRAGI